MEIAEDLLRHGEHVLGEDLNSIIVDSLSAIHEVISFNIGELLCKTFAILVLLLVTRSVRVEPVWDNGALETVVLAYRDTGNVLL